MDSGNSGSIQSSSGDDDYDTRAPADTSFSHNPSSSAHPIFNPSSAMFDPLSNYFDPPISSRPHNQTQPQNSLLNLDMISWPKSQHNSSDHINNNHLFFGTSTPLSFPQVSETIAATSSAAMAGNINPVVDQSSTENRAARNPKKRSRASRRAPTTVLTTDTSNFRAMVQEFTGIPAPPFTSNSSQFPRTRLDLFTSPTPSLIRSHPFPYNQNHNLLRPFPHKIQPPFSSSPSPSSLLNNSNINITNNTLNITSATPLLKTPNTNLVNNNNNNVQMQNTFQSFLQPPSPKFQHTSSNNRFGHGQEDDGVITGFNFTHNNDNLNFEGNKGLTENVTAVTTASTTGVTTTRGEGLMDSWICSSD